MGAASAGDTPPLLRTVGHYVIYQELVSSQS